MRKAADDPYLVLPVVVFLLGLGFAWLADKPGDMVVTLEGYQYRVSLMVAAVGVVAVVAAVMIGWWLVKSVWNSPYSVAGIFAPGGATAATRRCRPA